MSAAIAKRNARMGLLMAISAAVTFCFYGPASRVAYDFGANVALIVMLTTFLRGLFLSAYCFQTRQKLFAEKTKQGQMVLAGILQAATTITLWSSLMYLEAPIVSIIMSLIPFFIWAFHIARAETKFNNLTLMLSVAAVVGVSLVLDVWGPHEKVSWIGAALAFFATVITAVRVDIYARQMKRKSPYVVGAENNIIASIFILPFVLWQFPQMPSPDGYMWLGIAVASVVVGTFFAFRGVGLLGSFSWSMLANLEPVAVAIASYLLINEVLSTVQYVGMAMVIISLLAYYRFGHAKEPQLVEEGV